MADPTSLAPGPDWGDPFYRDHVFQAKTENEDDCARCGRWQWSTMHISAEALSAGGTE